MSSRRSRFKIAANIPVRRKVALSTDVQDENVKCVEPTVKSENSTQENVNIANESKTNSVIENSAFSSITQQTTEKISRFKLVKAPVNVPIKRQTFNDERLKVEPKLDDISIVLLNSDKDNNFKKQANVELQSQLERQKTPPPALLPSLPLGVLKSPNRGRFVRPSLVDSANRRHSFHVSSASESEDESRRLQNASKTRKLSESSTKFDSSALINQSSDKHFEGVESVECARLALMPKRRRPKVSNFVRKIAEARRDFKKKFAREKPERSKLTMFDLIFYNPPSNNTNEIEIEPKQDIVKPNIIQEEIVAEEDADDPDNNDSDNQDEVAVPVPQVKIGANGEIILDEKSLVIETTEAKKGREALMNAVPVFEDKNRRVSYFGKKKSIAKEWTPIETKCFYKALNSLGTDFAMMQALFPDRSRADLKNKFKREDRINSHLIDIALLKPSSFNVERLKVELDIERSLVEKETKRQIEEKVKAEQRRKEIQYLKKELNQDEHHCVSALKQFVEGDKLTRLGKEERSKRGPQRRKLSMDYVDPFQVSDDSLTRFKKPREAINFVKKKDVDHDVKFNMADSTICVKLCPKRGRPKKCVEETIVYYPDEQNISDSDSLQSISLNEKTEEIENGEFVELINQNIQNLKQTTIRFLAPSPTNKGNTKIRVVVDISDADGVNDMQLPVIENENNNTSLEQNCVLSKSDNQLIAPSHIGSTDEESFIDEPQQTIQNEYEVVVDNLNTLPPNECDSLKNSNDTFNLIKKIDEQNNPIPANENDMPGLFEGPIILEDSDTHDRAIVPTYSFENNTSIESSKPESSNTEISTEESVKKQSSCGFQYSVIESGTSSEQKRTYLAGLTPGSFVFMASETSAPLEQRCSMYMISEKISTDGNKEFVPIPVFLPPDLMKLITDEMK